MVRLVTPSPPRRARTPGSLATLRRTNTRRVIDALRGAQSLSRAEIARITGLSRSTVSTVVGDLIDSGVLREGAADRPSLGGTGRPGVTVSLDPGGGAALGIDVALDGIRVIVSDLAGSVLDERWGEADTTTLDPDALVAMAAQSAHDSMEAAGVASERLVGCAVAVPAPVHGVTGVIGAESGITPLVGVRLSPLMEARLGFPVHVENDANLCAVAERLWGGRAGHDTMLYVKLSKGVGAGVLLGGRLFRGAHGNAGEIGHTSLAPDGALCRCGNRGCLELMVSTDALVAAAAARGEPEPPIEELVARALVDDTVARRSLRDVGAMLGQALGAAVNLLNPSLIIIGGDLAPAWEILETPMREWLDRCAVHSSAEGALLVPGTLGRRTEALGAIGYVLLEAGRLAVPSP